MFWKKKEMKEPTKLYKRIEKLYEKMKETFSENYSFHDDKYVRKEFNSNLGKRIFKIFKRNKKCEYGKILYTYYEVCYMEKRKFVTISVPFFSYDDINKEIFNLKVYENKTKLKPYPAPLTAHEIDLAILEFENYIDKIYKEHTKKIKELEG